MMIKTDPYHTAEEIAPHTWRIDEAGLVNCYLLEGAEAALLIDAACGAGDLRACVTALTDKPVTVAVTHRHPDHVGGAWRFGSYYADRRDKSPACTLLCLPFFSRAMVRFACRKRGAFTWPRHAAVLSMENGHVFDLGSRSVLVRAVPGHTAGSVIFIDRKEKLVFTGDDINPDLWMQLPGCTGLKTWCRGADRILSLIGGGFTAWNGHGSGRQSLAQAQRTRRLVSELLQKRQEGRIRKRRGSYPSPHAKIVIRYRF